ncbi:MAG TPA: SDR family oxidoreductase [Acidimicrobiales bacterium]|nr:SDR family oxidoreductase [Acidimicrobiales bacterium]
MTERNDPIAIIGMRGRFPGANDLEILWRNLSEGVESITPLSRDEMRAAGVPDHITSLPGYVNAAPLLDDVDMFDAGFFGFSGRDAALTDPQHRVFLETAWEALEDAGYDPSRYDGPIGVFGGCELSSYLYQLHQNPEALGYIDGMQIMVTNDKDHLCTQVSYRLNLRGPSVVVQTTCSTSLVAIGMACESVRAGRCDMALAGGVTVRVPQRGGYFYVAGSILSPDGHCRPFDANAQGTIVGSGVGLVVLKRLEDALVDGDNIRAVIRAVGINNDGSDKAGYTAPGVRGQARAVAAAYEAAGVSADTIGYVEAHGTGTILGDPIELSALTEVFRAHTDRRGFCGIGSVKSNFGHLSCASGVTGLIKTVLTLEHGAIPPTLHYESPNPAIDFASSPFYVTTELQPWVENGSPRRAAVSSFGIGGTNAHAVIEQAPPTPPSQTTDLPMSVLLTLSARSRAALDEATRRLGEHIDRHPEQDLADVAYTLHVGRREFHHRRAVAVDRDDRTRTVALLSDVDRLAASEVADAPKVVFMFPGQGTQYPGMASRLYATEAIVHDSIDECCDILNAELGLDLRDVLFPDDEQRDGADGKLRDTALAQPALFVVEYALTELWRSWGIRPSAMIGHSVGEFVAATVAGVMSLPDALRLLAERGRLISALPAGSMLSVMAAAEDIADLIGDDIALAAANAPGLSVLSGPTSAIERVERELESRAIASRRLHTSHAFHSSMMDPILDRFERVVSTVALAEPSVPYVATKTGAWAGAESARPEYWSGQLRSAVRFEDALRTLGDSPSILGKDEVVFVEVGPGRALKTFADQTAKTIDAAWRTLTTLPSADEPDTGATLMSAVGCLWERGAPVDWTALHADDRRRVSLPTYPFERQSYWIGPPVRAIDTAPPEARDVSGWFYVPEWCPSGPARAPHYSLADAPVLVMDEGDGLGAAVADRLRQSGARTHLVRRRRPVDADDTKDIDGDVHVVDPDDADSYARVAASVCATGRLAGVVDCWAACPPGTTDLDTGGHVLFQGALRLAQALGHHATVRPLPFVVAARGTDRVREGDEVDPARAFSIGATRVLPQEHPGNRFTHVDVDDHPALADLLIAELTTSSPEPQVALRDGERYVRDYRKAAIADNGASADLPDRPVVFVTGGLGHMGMALSEAVFDAFDARLVLLGRSPLPDPEQWAEQAADRHVDEQMRETLRRLEAMRAVRDDVLVVSADMRDEAEVRAAVESALARFGTIDVVVHGAANVGPSAFGSAEETTASVIDNQISPKLRGLELLREAMRGREPSLWVLHSSISSVLGGLGLAAYAGANAVLDSIAAQGGPSWLSIGWDAWDNAAEAQMPGMPVAIQPAEGQAAFVRMLRTPVDSRIVVAVGDLDARLESWVRRSQPSSASAPAERYPRPHLATPFVAPATDTEQSLAEIWANQLGLLEVGVHDRFFELGGHSLLAVQVASEIRDRFQIEMPVLQLFKAPTVHDLAGVVEAAVAGETAPLRSPDSPSSTEPTDTTDTATPSIDLAEGPGGAAKAGYRDFYDDVTRRLAATGMGEASFFLNYGYVSRGPDDEAVFDVPDATPNRNSVRLALELVGETPLTGRDVLDVGCGRGGTAALLAEQFGAAAVGVDLSPEAVTFCRAAHRATGARFEVGDAEHLPCDDRSFDVVVNVESSHTYPDMRAFLREVSRVLRPDGQFLHTDLLAGQRWLEVQAVLAGLGFAVISDRDITANVLASCNEIAESRTAAFGARDAAIDNFLAVPGSPVYEQMASGAWEYRIVRSQLRS